MNKRIIVIVMLVLVSLVAGCKSTDGLLDDLDNIIDEVENAIDEVEDSLEELDLDIDLDIDDDEDSEEDTEVNVDLNDVDDALLYKNSTTPLKQDDGYNFFSSATIDDAKAYYIKLLEGTDGYQILDNTAEGSGVLIGGTHKNIYVGVAIIPFETTSRIALKYE